MSWQTGFNRCNSRLRLGSSHIPVLGDGDGGVVCGAGLDGLVTSPTEYSTYSVSVFPIKLAEVRARR